MGIKGSKAQSVEGLFWLRDHVKSPLQAYIWWLLLGVFIVSCNVKALEFVSYTDFFHFHLQKWRSTSAWTQCWLYTREWIPTLNNNEKNRWLIWHSWLKLIRDGKVIKVPFAVGVGMRYMYLEISQVCIAQGNPKRPTKMILEECPTKECCQWC